MHTQAQTGQEHLKDAMLSMAAAALAYNGSAASLDLAEDVAKEARGIAAMMGEDPSDCEYRDDDAEAMAIVLKFEEIFGW